DVIYTPGHTDDSYSFRLPDRVFTGDTLLIRGTGRTDFQNGDPRQQYDSIFRRLLKLPNETLVYPAHDYKGDTVSTIGEEKAHNPRLQTTSVEEYVALMNSLKLPNPKMMDVAVPANMKVGLHQEEFAARGWAVTALEAFALAGKPDVAVIDLRERSERERHSMRGLPRLPMSREASMLGKRRAAKRSQPVARYPAVTPNRGMNGIDRAHELAATVRTALAHSVRSRRSRDSPAMGSDSKHRRLSIFRDPPLPLTGRGRVR